MAKVTIKLNTSEIGKLLKSDDVKEMLEKAAESKAQGWETDTKLMSTRHVASIVSTDRDQISEELDSHRIVGGLK